jgi:hypothetical protein
LPLARRDALDGTAVTRRAAQPHFDEHQHAPVACDQVDLAEARAEIARDDGQTLLQQERRRERFGAAARRDQGVESIGTSAPSR